MNERKYDPQKDPSYHKAIEHVKKFGSQMVFSSEGERKDYEKAVNSHPGNVYGIPAFMPRMYKEAKGGAYAVVVCQCGFENVWEIHRHASYSAKCCSKCSEFISWSRTN